MAQKASRVPRVAHAPDLHLGERLHGRQNALRHHAGQVHRVAQAVPLENLPRAPARPGFDPVLANPVGPLEAAGIEMDGRQHDAPGQFRLVGHGRREEGRVEHLEGDARRGDAHAAQFADLARRPAGGDDPKDSRRLSATVSKSTLCQYRAP